MRWSRDTGGRISGGTVVLGDLVFVSTLRKTTHAYGARTGQKVWDTNKGAFNPAIGDGDRVYLVGYASLFAMKPRADAQAERRKRVTRRQRDKARARRTRFEKNRYGVHGHRHPERLGRHCHRHRHEREIEGRIVVVEHKHCHRHIRRGR